MTRLRHLLLGGGIDPPFWYRFRLRLYFITEWRDRPRRVRG